MGIKMLKTTLGCTLASLLFASVAAAQSPISPVSPETRNPHVEPPLRHRIEPKQVTSFRRVKTVEVTRVNRINPAKLLGRDSAIKINRVKTSLVPIRPSNIGRNRLRHRPAPDQMVEDGQPLITRKYRVKRQPDLVQTRRLRLRNDLAQLDRVRDMAIESGNLQRLRQADVQERLIRRRYQDKK